MPTFSLSHTCTVLQVPHTPPSSAPFRGFDFFAAGETTLAVFTVSLGMLAVVKIHLYQQG